MNSDMTLFRKTTAAMQVYNVYKILQVVNVTNSRYYILVYMLYYVFIKQEWNENSLQTHY